MRSLNKHESVNSFINMTYKKKFEEIKMLTAMENKLSKKDDPYVALGFGLFKMWDGAVAEGDSELVDSFSIALEPLSRKG